MKNLSASHKTFFALIILLALLSAAYVFLPQGAFLPTTIETDEPIAKPMLALINVLLSLILYGGLGFAGIHLMKKLEFADLWDPQIGNRQRFMIPAMTGLGLGVFFIIADSIIAQFHSLGPIPHPPFPASLFASAIAGIGEEILFRLFFTSLWVWLISSVLLKGRWKAQIFWGVSLLAALAFSFAHAPSAMMILGLSDLQDIPLPIWVEIFLLNGTFSFFAAYFLRKYGFLAAVSVHFWTDIMWHVIWGLF